MTLKQQQSGAISRNGDSASFGRIGVLMGGYSSEREISLKSGKAVFEALHQYGCNVAALDIVSQDEKVIVDLIKTAHVEIAFIVLHGRLGEDGRIQSILEKMGILYVGSNAEASRRALDKTVAQQIFRENNIPVPENAVVGKGEKIKTADILEKLNGLPVVVKPASEGSSIGVTLVDTAENLSDAVDNAFRYDDKVLIERYINGRALTVGILGQEALPVIEVRPKNKFFDFTSKYQSGMTDYIVPALLSRDVALRIQSIALKAHRVLGCSDFSRVDIMIDKEDCSYVLEVNTIPGFTSTSLLPKAAKVIGLDFTQLCLRLIGLACVRQDGITARPPFK